MPNANSLRSHPCRHLRPSLHRPANILLSGENVPVLVDFGFAERYDVSASDAFHSNLSYGTPEVCLFLHISLRLPDSHG